MPGLHEHWVLRKLHSINRRLQVVWVQLHPHCLFLPGLLDNW
jgi:hypothetical protein